MNLKQLFKVAKQGAKGVYSDFHKIWITDFRLKVVVIDGVHYQRLDIAGTNEGWDWLSNIAIFSWKKFKIGSWIAARRIFKSNYFKMYRNPTLPLIITGHSKGAGTALVFMKMYGDLKNDWCVAFNPCPVFRRSMDRTMKKTFIFINKHDLVSIAGIVSFGHPDCIKYYNYVDLGNELDNHNIDQWDESIRLA